MFNGSHIFCPPKMSVTTPSGVGFFSRAIISPMYVQEQIDSQPWATVQEGKINCFCKSWNCYKKPPQKRKLIIKSVWKDSVPDTSLFLVRTCSIFSSLTRLYITPKKKGEGNTPHCRQSLELSLIGERRLWPQLSAAMESCWCDSSFLHSQIQWDRWKQSVILLLPILQESERDSNLVKAEWDAFNLQRLKGSSFYVIWAPLTGKWKKWEKLIHFFLQMTQNAGVHIFLFFVLSWKFEDSSVHSFSREKWREGNSHWRSRRCMK